MKTVNFASQCGLGDCLLHAHWLRKAQTTNPGVRFNFFVRSEIVREIFDVLVGTGIGLSHLGHAPADAITVPLHAADMPPDADLRDFIGCKLWQYHTIADRAGLKPACTSRADWLFDHHELRRPCILSRPFDVLVVNAAPRSGQWQGYYPADLGTLVHELAANNEVITTHAAPGAAYVTDHYGLTTTQIGQLSTLCTAIVAVATGPIWPTFNAFNLDSCKLRVVLIDDERIELAPHTHHARTLDEARAILRAHLML